MPPFLAGLLVRRGIATSEAARDFLCPKLTLLADPFALPNMGVAVERILQALTRANASCSTATTTWTA